MKTTISEACNNAVEHAYRGQSGAIAVHVDVGFESVDVSVRDWGGGFQHLTPAGDRMRVGLPVINALADRAEFLTAPGSGTEVRMGFDIRHDPRRDGLLARVEESEDLEAWTPWRRGLSGDVVVTLLPRELLGGVVEPLISALVARSRFALERFSDVYLVTRAITAHVQAAASSGRVSFALGADTDRIDMTIGPLRAGADRALRSDGRTPSASRRRWRDWPTRSTASGSIALSSFGSRVKADQHDRSPTQTGDAMDLAPRWGPCLNHRVVTRPERSRPAAR